MESCKVFRLVARKRRRIELGRISFARYCDLYLTQIHIDPAVWYIAVGLGHPGGAGAPKGWVVHPLKTYMSWVQNVARQFGSIS